MMKTSLPMPLLLLLFVLPPLFSGSAGAADEALLFREKFLSLDNWQPFFFPKIGKHTRYTLAEEDGKHVLKAESDASASALVYKESFNVYDYPRVRWRWKVMNVYPGGDTRGREGDDYPLRVYIMFDYDPAAAGPWQRLEYGVAKALYGVYPPSSSLNYVWANRDLPGRVVTSPYTSRSKMILLQKGTRNTGAWQDEEVDIVSDYRTAFGSAPPARARIAVMNDADNTGGHSVSYLEYLEVGR